MKPVLLLSAFGETDNMVARNMNGCPGPEQVVFFGF